jgi:hypothetical protein
LTECRANAGWTRRNVKRPAAARALLALLLALALPVIGLLRLRVPGIQRLVQRPLHDLLRHRRVHAHLRQMLKQDVQRLRRDHRPVRQLRLRVLEAHLLQPLDRHLPRVEQLADGGRHRLRDDLRVLAHLRDVLRRRAPPSTSMSKFPASSFGPSWICAHDRSGSPGTGGAGIRTSRCSMMCR